MTMSAAAPVDGLPAELAARYLKNLSALYAADAELAADIDAIPFRQLPELEPTRDGHLTMRITSDEGRRIYVHSRYRPVEEAEALIARAAERRTAQTDDQPADQPPADDADAEAVDPADLDNSVFMFAGAGLGYHIAAVEGRFRQPLMIVAEDDLRLIKAALLVTDLTIPLHDARLRFVTEADKGHLHERIGMISAHIMLGLNFITLPHTARYHAAFHRELLGLIHEFVMHSRIQLVSLLRHARITCRNIANNLGPYIRQSGVEVLENRARGYPAIVVAAGPSLAYAIDALPELRKRAVVIAVQTVFQLLRAKDAAPHFVASLDYHVLSSRFFYGIEDFGPTALVAEPKAHWSVLDAYQGRTHVLRSEFAELLLQDAAPSRGGLKAGSTVAHLCFYLARHLGCDPIILVGQDLSFSQGLHYLGGMPVEDIWRLETGRFQTVEMKQWERVARARSSLRRVKDVRGRDVYVDATMHSYAEQLQTDIRQTSAQVIQSADAGLPLSGAVPMKFEDAVAKYCTRPLPEGLFEHSAARASAADYDRAAAALEQRIRDVREIHDIATETRTLLEKLVKLIDRPREFNRLVARVDELRVRLTRSEQAYAIVRAVSQTAEFRRVHADRAIHDDVNESAADTRRRLRRDREFVSSFIDGCEYLLEMLPAAIQRLREQSP